MMVHDSIIFASSKLIPTEADVFYIKAWVKEHFVPNELINAFWHPVVKKEWKKAQERFELTEKMNKLDRESRSE